MIMEQLEILKRYPCLIPRTMQYTYFEGYIYEQNEEYHVKLRVPNYPKLNNLYIKVLHHGLPLNIRADDFDLTLSLYELLKQLEKKLVPLTTINIQKNLKLNMKFIKDCESLILKYHLKLHIKSDMTEVMIKDNNHFLQVQYSETGMYRVNQHSLPELKENENCKKFKDGLALEGLYVIFEHNLRLLDRFYADLDEIDLVCCVIDPLNPTTRDTHRQIVLGDNISMIIELFPWKYGGLPNLKFIGPDRETDKFTERVSHNLQNWSSEVNLFRNLLSLLDLMYFPSSQKADNISNEKDEPLIFDGECCICSASRLNDMLPNIICENKSCGQYFHRDCLYEWLAALEDSHKSFDHIQGNCPSCNMTISCPV